ncbi:hypothetical protein RRG08_014816 [Elysia crispata]|uniref:Uncharacterized protein n=1 Tax=Elysia crispata TaxID=231223 RepID=A0AAE0ZAG7_9GAST|nr:hypothetical protein RRG08_014816 [Elysia crispata]
MWKPHWPSLLASSCEATRGECPVVVPGTRYSGLTWEAEQPGRQALCAFGGGEGLLLNGLIGLAAVRSKPSLSRGLARLYGRYDCALRRLWMLTSDVILIVRVKEGNSHFLSHSFRSSRNEALKAAALVGTRRSTSSQTSRVEISETSSVEVVKTVGYLSRPKTEVQDLHS